MKYYLEKIIASEYLSFTEAKQFIFDLYESDTAPEIIGSILVGIEQRGIQLEELKGFRSAQLELCYVPQIDSTKAIDVCGTGGDGKNTFNISTTTAFVLAGLGYKVIKHGNYGVSSICGSSNVLEALGHVFTDNSSQLQDDLEKNNICFLHAPLFHPTMKKIAPIRKNLGVRTLFNCLGPLVNPVQPPYQLTGTFSQQLALVYQHILKSERSDFRIVYGLDGYDELSLTDNTRILGKECDFVLSAEDFQRKRILPSELYGGATVDEAATILIDILSGKGSPSQNAVTAANVTLARSMFHPGTSLVELFNDTYLFIQSGSCIQTIPFLSCLH